MNNQISVTLNYFNSVRHENPNFLPKLKGTRYSVWPRTGNAKFDGILDQRLYKIADNSVRDCQDEHYESSIAMSATASEMLTYLLFFVHTNSFDIPTEDDFSNQQEFIPIKETIDQTENVTFRNSFGEKGNQSKRIAVLRNCKITKEAYADGGKGHDISAICDSLEEIHKIRIKYLHHWAYTSDTQRKKDTVNVVDTFLSATNFRLLCLSIFTSIPRPKVFAALCQL